MLGALFVLLCGLFMCYIGLTGFGKYFKQKEIRIRFRDTVTRPIAEAPGDGPVKIRGTVRALDQKLVHMPFPGREVVWYRVTVCEVHGRDARQLFDESGGCAFSLDDGSGQNAVIQPDDATIMVDVHQMTVCTDDYPEHSPYNQESYHPMQPLIRYVPVVNTEALLPEWEAFLAARQIRNPGRLRCSFECIAPGDNLCALGPSRRIGQSDNVYRATTPQIVLFTDDQQQDPLYLTDASEERFQRPGSSGTIIVGLVVLAIGIMFLLLFVVSLTNG